MAETFSGFGVNLGGENPFEDKPGFLNQFRFRAGEEFKNNPQNLLQTIPPQLIEQFNRIAQQGILSDEELSELGRMLSQQFAQKRKRLSKGLRQTLGRKLGPRSGAIDTLIANKVFAPSFEGEIGAQRNLKFANLQSRLIGLQGIPDILRFMQDQTRLDEDIRQANQGPGFLDFVGPLATIGGAIFGGPAGAAAGAAVGGAVGGGRRPRNPVGGGGFNAPLLGVDNA